MALYGETKWRGGKCPVKRSVIVTVRLRDGDILENVEASVLCLKRRGNGKAGGRDYWQRTEARDDILGYRIEKSAREAE